MTITKKVTLIPAPVQFIGTSIKIALTDPDSLTWGMKLLTLAEGREKAIIDWGDGSITELTEDGVVTHNYAATGEYDVRLSDDVATIQSSDFPVSSAFYSVYAPMIRVVHSNATRLLKIDRFCFNNAVNMHTFRYEGSGLAGLNARAFALCASLSGRLDFPGVSDIVHTTFADCTGITELHFSEAKKAEIMSLPAWDQSGGKFGAENAVCKFDL